MAGGSGFYLCTACDAVRIGAKPLQNGGNVFCADENQENCKKQNIGCKLRKKEWIWRNLHIRQEEN